MQTPEQKLPPIESLADLEGILAFHGINFLAWSEGRKDAAHLFAELAEGETEIAPDEEHQIVRQTRVLTVAVHYVDADGNEYQLCEDRQEWHDKKDEAGNPRVDRRGHKWLSEKIKNTEVRADGSIADAALVRTLHEELNGVDEFESTEFLGCTAEIKESASYPGLFTKYLIYSYKVYLPREQYRPSYAEVGDEKTTFFEWLLVNPEV
jgi:hypothetical protein